MSWLLGLAWALLAQPCAAAQDHILERAVWTDTSGAASFDQARSATYIPYTGVLSKGFNANVQWIRLKIAAIPSDLSSALVLRIRPVYLTTLNSTTRLKVHTLAELQLI